MKKKKYKGTIFIVIIIFLLYFILFPQQTGKDFTISPLKRIDLSSETEPIENYSNKEVTEWFRVGDTFGYIDSDLNILHKGNVDYNVALSNGGFINFSSIQEGEQGFVYCNVRGILKSSFRYSGYPILNEDGKRLLVAKTDGTGIREVSLDGDELWAASFASVITALGAAADYTLLGFLNGNLKLYNSEGKCLYSLSLRDAKASCVYGCALSRNEKAIAAVYGLAPQRIVISKRDSSVFGKPTRKEIDTDFRKPVYMKFSNDGRYLFVGGKQRILVMDTESLSFKHLQLAGTFESLSQSETAFESVIISKNEGEIGIYMLSLPDIILAREQFQASETFAKMFESRLLVGIGNDLVIYNLGRI